jgi:hypothetical protein
MNPSSNSAWRTRMSAVVGMPLLKREKWRTPVVSDAVEKQNPNILPINVAAPCSMVD